MTGETRLIRVSVKLLSQFGARTEDGRRLTATWGEPVGTAPEGEPVYELTFTAADDGERVVVAARLEKLEAVAAAARAADGLPALITELLRKYGGTMKGRGDHRIFDALVRYRNELPALRAALDHLGEETP